MTPQYVISLEEGHAGILLPSVRLSKESIDDLEDYLLLMLRILRRIQQDAAAKAAEVGT